MDQAVQGLCHRFEENLYFYLDGELEQDEQEQFHQHVLSCASCRQLEAEAREMEQELKLGLDLRPPANSWEKFQSRLASEESLDVDIQLPESPKTSRWMVLGTLGLATAAGLLFTLKEKPAPVETVQVEVAREERSLVVFNPSGGEQAKKPSQGIQEAVFQPSRSASLQVEKLGSFERNESALQMKIEATESDLQEEDLPELSEIVVDAKALDRMVTVASAFSIDYLPVTNQEYQRFVDATGHKTPFHWGGPNHSQVDPEGLQPVTYISWEDARSFCEWEGKRLPSISEWEYAARGNTSRPYPWGGEFSKKLANTRESGLGLVNVGSFSGNISPVGVRDMLGNVREWTMDEPAEDTILPTQRGRLKIMKGASFTDPASTASVLSQYTGDREAILGNAGVRCALNAKK